MARSSAKLIAGIAVTVVSLFLNTELSKADNIQPESPSASPAELLVPNRSSHTPSTMSHTQSTPGHTPSTMSHAQSTISQTRATSRTQISSTAQTGKQASPNNNSAFAKGKIVNVPFAIKEAYFDGRVLLLKTGKMPAHRSAYEDQAFTGLKIVFPSIEPMTGNTYYVLSPAKETMNANGESKPRPDLTLYYVEDADWFTASTYKGKYAMTVRFFAPVKGVFPGHIELKIDQNHTDVKGYFYARKGTFATPI